MYEQNIQNLTKQFCQVLVNDFFRISHVVKLATQPNTEKFNSDKTKLKAFFTQLNLKLHCNIDYFTTEKQITKQNKLSYAISRLERNAFAKIELYILAKKIDFENINQFVEVLKTCFSEFDPVDTAKHKLYQLYQMNKDLKVFLNTFL